MSYDCIILARGGSKGIPNKNIMDFCGSPLITWSIKQAKETKQISKVYVSTDHFKISEVAWDAGAVVVQRPRHLALDNSTSEDALIHAIAETKSENVVFLQCTSPLRLKDDISKAIEVFEYTKADSLFSCSKMKDPCIWIQKDKDYISFTYDYAKRTQRQNWPEYLLENGSIYIFKSEMLKKNDNRLSGKIQPYIMQEWQSYEIDEKEDVEICEYFMRKNILK
jgi:N-acylneuraminate cytidylyltransferase